MTIYFKITVFSEMAVVVRRIIVSYELHCTMRKWKDY